MEEQIPSSSVPSSNVPLPGQITPEQLELLKARARELAIQQVLSQPQEQPVSPYVPQSKVVYVRRNLTVAELLLLLLLSCGIVTGVQWSWNTVSNLIPKIEIKVR